MIKDAFSSWARRYRIPLSFVFGISVLIWAKPTLASVISGLPAAVLGEALRTWSSGHIKKNKELATDGPYAYTRNPLYLGSFLMGLGFVIMADNLYILIAFLVGFSLIYHAVVRGEEAGLERTFGRGFRDYRDRVPRFFPRFRRDPYGTGLFEWRLVQKHREYRAWLGITGGLIFILLKAGG